MRYIRDNKSDYNEQDYEILKSIADDADNIRQRLRDLADLYDNLNKQDPELVNAIVNAYNDIKILSDNVEDKIKRG